MQLPSWLINATGAMPFANNPANGFQPTIGDALQGIGHSMMSHYRRDPTEAPGGPPTPPPQPGFMPGGVPANPTPQMLQPIPGMALQPAAPHISPMSVNPSPVTPTLWTGQGATQAVKPQMDISQVLAMLQGMR